jgi:hypothetical protein
VRRGQVFQFGGETCLEGAELWNGQGGEVDCVIEILAGWMSVDTGMGGKSCLSLEELRHLRLMPTFWVVGC